MHVHLHWNVKVVSTVVKDYDLFYFLMGQTAIENFIFGWILIFVGPGRPRIIDFALHYHLNKLQNHEYRYPRNYEFLLHDENWSSRNCINPQ